jgi:hypothetical protein
VSEHTCHATGCIVAVPPKLFLCRAHWFQLPRQHRNAIWATYRPGQERDKQLSVAYLDAADAAIAWLAAEEARLREGRA